MISWHPQAWQDYLYWQQTDKRLLKRINALIKDIERNPFDGIGKPEPLKYEWSGFWSRRIDKKEPGSIIFLLDVEKTGKNSAGYTHDSIY